MRREGFVVKERRRVNHSLGVILRFQKFVAAWSGSIGVIDIYLEASHKDCLHTSRDTIDQIQHASSYTRQ